MHQLGDNTTFDPYPPTARHDDGAAHRALGVSAAGLALTGLIELAIAAMSGSAALLSDAVHNLSDVSTSAVVFVGLRVSRRLATPSHPYGYERAEDLAGLAIAAVIWASAVAAGVVSYHKLVAHGRTSHLGLGMAAAVVGIVGNQLVARYKDRVGRRIRSATLTSDAKHSWLDAISSAGALAGLVAVAGGWMAGDAVAGLAVTAIIIHVAVEVTSEHVRRLMDGIDPELLARAEAATASVAGVAHAHLRARWLGRSLIVEVEGFVDAGLSIEQAELIGRAVEGRVRAATPEVTAVSWCPRTMPR